MPKAYFAGFLKMRDPAWLKEYRPKTLATIEKHGGRYLVASGKGEAVEGERPDMYVIVEFPSLEAAKAWYADPDYAPMIKLRQSGSDIQFVVAEGLE